MRFQMDPNRTEYKRSVYTWFEMLADVGGFIVCFYLFGYIINYILVRKVMGCALENQLVSRLFERRRTAEGNRKSDATTVAKVAQEELKSREPLRRCYNPFSCLINRGLRRGYMRAKQSLWHELDLYTYFRKMKQFEGALSVLFSSKERYLLAHQGCMVLREEEAPGASESDEVDGEAKNGPKRSVEWWSDLKSKKAYKLLRRLNPHAVFPAKQRVVESEAPPAQNDFIEDVSASRIEHNASSRQWLTPQLTLTQSEKPEPPPE